ncbi:MAG: hypothetical protein ACTHKZ_07160 [Lysobacteraceae bacterium]
MDWAADGPRGAWSVRAIAGVATARASASALKRKREGIGIVFMATSRAARLAAHPQLASAALNAR